MKREEITISGLIKVIESGKGKDVSLRTWQIAQLFNIYQSTVIANVKAIIKSDLIIPNYNCPLVQTGKTLLPEIYDLEMIITLSFRIHSAEAREFRKWIIEKVIHKNINMIIAMGLNNYQLN